MSTATCIDCGLDVTYQDEAFWAWKGIDGSDLCNRNNQRDGSYNWGHRIPRTEAEDIFKVFEAKTGKKARHA